MKSIARHVMTERSLTYVWDFIDNTVFGENIKLEVNL